MDTYDIWKQGGKWKLVREGSERALGSFDKKSKAVSFGREYVRNEGGYLRIWSADGKKLQEQRTYTGAEAEAVSEESVATQKVRKVHEDMGAPETGFFGGVARGARDAGKAAGQVVPVVGEFINRGAYGAAYYAAYGVVFAAVTIGRAIPMPTPFARGLHEGTEAAIDSYEKGHAEIPHQAAAAGS
jgi:hypothetical protein